MKHAVLITVLTSSLAACWPGDDAPSDSAAEPLRSVRSMVVSPAAISRMRSYPSVLEPPELVALTFEVGGRLNNMSLNVGQQVAVGDLIASLSPNELDLQTQQAEAALDEARAADRNAQDEATRQQALFDRQVVSRAALDRALAQADQATARTRQAERALALVQNSRQDAVLDAPFDGVINSIEARSHANVTPGQPIVTVYEHDLFEATVHVSYNVSRAISIGQPVAVTLTGSNEALTGNIAEIGRRAANVAAFPVVIALTDPPETLRPGLAVEVEIFVPLPEEAHGITLPFSAIATQFPGDFDGQPPYAATVLVLNPGDDDTAHLEARKVTIGAATDEGVTVTGGLVDGEQVVTAGLPFLFDGQRVAFAATDENLLAEAGQ